MSHIEIHTIKGRKYKYEVTNYRVGKKVKHKWKYLGPVDPLNKRRNPNAGRKPVIFVRKMTEGDVGKLELAKKSNDAFIRDRAKILLLSSQKISPKEIAKRLACEVRKVRQGVKDFNEKGIAALQRGKAKGAIPKFTEAAKKLVLLHFSKMPREFGYHFTTWTLPKFRKHLIDYRVVDSISIETVRHILFEAGARLKKSKRRQYSPDKNFDKKKLR